MMHKFCKIGMSWVLVKLTPEEATIINNQAEETHDLQMKHALHRAQKILDHAGVSEDVVRVALGLFDKEATPTAFIREEAIDRKAEKLNEEK